MIDDLYPSPLRIPTKYTGKLTKKRPYKEPPRNGEEYPTAKLRGLASNDYDAELQEHTDQQMQLDLEGMELLAEHYNIEYNNSGEFWFQIALHLARDHVPWFQMEGKRGRPPKWNEQEYALLQVRLIEKQAEGLTLEKAIDAITPLYPQNSRNDRNPIGLQRRYEEAQTLAKSGDTKYSTKEFLEISKLPIEAITIIREKLEKLCDQIKTEDNIWLDKQTTQIDRE
ncbi:MAG: hypothetical protein JAZ20_03430 [Candidatus Thiodiazotropha weberae]|nr:hypothetical protein [Candidatus Thiodiazotropha lotti]MCG8010730.1 hypothetical protein [Candidatus Thiodiazotropha lotti]MCG8019451.1 hypothetical protein [Candidatus Thiodiazotropha lotti]MCW4206613.1 hypothetical protein [Candidatus Thiodiazotropha lotti]MCW4210189.1 hypothetical protein [Candidatus Thiodiazotropha lotti]